MKRYLLLTLIFLLTLAISACSPQPATQSSQDGLPRVLVVETFLADIVQNVAGDRLKVETLMPSGIDPHSYQPSPQDVARIAESDLLILNQLGLEEALEKILLSAGGEFILVEASAGLTSRELADALHESEGVHEGEGVHDEEASLADPHHDTDPHFWLDPINVITFVNNIRDGLIQVDPVGAEVYTRNAETFTAELIQLDIWIAEQVDQILPPRRLLVTNHESLGYFADRYGFTIVGSIIPSVTTGASPSAQDLASLISRIKETGAPAVFLETGTNPRLAEQLEAETGIKIAPGIYSHSTTEGEGPASSYLEMMRYNTTVIVDALK